MKKCPLRRVIEAEPILDKHKIQAVGKKVTPTFCDCLESQCAWWIYKGEMRTTENLSAQGMCAIQAIAFRNSEGKIPV